MTVHGNLNGLKSAQKKSLERLTRRRIPAERIITPELSQTLAYLSREISRQIGLFIDRQGQVVQVAVGNATQILLPDFGRLRAGEQRFRGLRFVHTHLRSEPLSRDDLTDLTRLRLDIVVAIGVGQDGAPGAIYMAHLLPPSSSDDTYRQLGPLNLGMLPTNFIELIESLEEEFRRQYRARAVRAQDERAILVHVATDRRQTAEAKRSLDELAELARTAGVYVIDSVIQIRKKPDSQFVMGRGKLTDVVVRAMQQDAELLILDLNLAPNQSRAISDITDMKVIDRTQLILDIFSQHAHSRDGKLQVELAQLKYLLPRLGQRDDSLSRLTGGIGGRGPGETKLEIGRRRARDRIHKLETKLAALSRARSQRRARRRRNGVPIVSIIGYTNAGKSTLLNALTQSKVLVEDKLFATLDTASRRLRFPREREVIITDTVGFIRDLPQDLLAAFKATLEELKDASLLLHVIDVADPAKNEHIRWVEQILIDLELAETPRLLVFNKMDLVSEKTAQEAAVDTTSVAISAKSRETFRPLLKQIETHLWPSCLTNTENASLSKQGGN
ncbi:MAG: GTPase HflX [Myxococcota bacterium]|nr:GTPase HflX [Myxococcota bacterium]